MIDQQHTTEPWRVRDGSDRGHGIWVDAPSAMIENPRGPDYPRQILEDEDYPEKLADAQRIVACVNACTGIGTEGLENGYVAKSIERAMRLEFQRDELLATLKRMNAMHKLMMDKVNHGASFYDANCIREMNEAPIQAAQVIANVEGEKL